jgi:uncharacterized protein (TIGR02145 family)
MNMKNTVLLMISGLTIVLLLIPNGCKKQDDPKENPTDPVVPETTKVIETQYWNDNIISIDSSDWTLTFKPEINNEYSLEVGDVLICTEGEGLLRKVSEVREEGNKLTVSTTDGTLVDALPTGRLNFNIDLTESFKDAEIIYLAKGVQFKELGNEKDDRISLVFSLEKELDDHLTISGELSIEPSVSGTIAWHGRIPDTIIMQYNIKEDLDILATVDIFSLELEKEITLAKVRLPTITVYIGVPVLITPVFKLKLGAGVEVNSEVTAGVHQELNFKTGFRYIKKNFNPFCEMSKDLSPIPPTLSNTLEAKAFVKPVIEMKIYEVLSPSLAMQLYALMEAELGASPWWTLYAGLSGEVGFKIGKWGFDILDISADVFDNKIPIANANTPINHKPEACFTVNPVINTVEHNFHFDASCCQDEEDSIEDLQVRWDWNDDGSWDTDYSTEKVIDHDFNTPGGYTIRLEVKDSEEATSETTKTVTVTANDPPEAKFSVTPTIGSTDTVFLFDASSSKDNEDPLEDLQVRWDWNGDGNFDTEFTYDKQFYHQYAEEGTFSILLEVKDTNGEVDQTTNQVMITNTGSGIPCPGFETVTYGGHVYNTVLIGNQCWMKENLNIGIRIDGGVNQSNNDVIEKYCFIDNEANCSLLGGLYQWNELMQYIETDGNQGICPEGWHIPTDDEWKILSGFIDSQYGIGDPEWDKYTSFFIGYDVGKRLKAVDNWGAGGSGPGIDSHGFTAYGAGQWSPNGDGFGFRNVLGLFWTSSTYSQSDKYYRKLSALQDGIVRKSMDMNYAFSVRCLKD